MVGLILDAKVEIIFNCLNEVSYFSLYILIAYLENFPKHYNTIFFYYSVQKL